MNVNLNEQVKIVLQENQDQHPEPCQECFTENLSQEEITIFLGNIPTDIPSLERLCSLLDAPNTLQERVFVEDALMASNLPNVTEEERDAILLCLTQLG